MVYGRSLDAPFIFDDFDSVIENPSIVRLWPLVGTAEQPGPLSPPIGAPVAGRPLVNLSLAVNYRIGEFNPSGYRLFNILIHGAGRDREAVMQLEEAIRIQPSFANAYARANRPREAIVVAERVRRAAVASGRPDIEALADAALARYRAMLRR